MKQRPDASRQIAKVKVEQLQLFSQQVDGANFSLSTQQLTALQDGTTQNVMIGIQVQSDLMTASPRGGVLMFGRSILNDHVRDARQGHA